MNIELQETKVFNGTETQIAGLVDGREVVVLQGSGSDGFRVGSSACLPTDYAKAEAMVECMRRCFARANEIVEYA